MPDENADRTSLPSPEDPSLERHAPIEVHLLSRRAILSAAGGAVLLGIGIAAVTQRRKFRGVLADRGIGELAGIERMLAAQQAYLEPIYRRTGVLPDEPVRRRLYLTRDWAAFLRFDHHHEASSVDDFVQTAYEPFVNRILEHYEKLRIAEGQNIPPNGIPSSVVRLTRLKRAFHAEAGQTYNKDAATTIHPVLQRRLQCFSGTRNILLLVQQLQTSEKLLTDGETLVEIYTPGHVHPGILLPDGRLMGFEMTSTGNALRDFGRMDAIAQPIRVVRADHAMFQDALGIRTHEDRVVLWDTVPTEEGQAPAQGSLLGRFGGSRSTSGLSRFGFGDVAVRSGDYRMTSAQYLPSSTSWSGAGSYQGVERSPSEAQLLARITDRAHRETVDEYLRHQSALEELYWKQHLQLLQPIMRNPTAVTEQGVLDAVRQCRRLAEEYREYVRRNTVREQYIEADRILRRYGLEIGVIDPLAQGDVIDRNIQKAMWRWAQEHPVK